MLRIAVVGVGFMGTSHLRIYKKFKDVRLVAVCDKDSKLVEEIARKFGTKFYPSHKDLIRNEKLDAVSIATPTNAHKEIALDFINKKIPILVEKPLASTSKDAQAIVNRADKNKVLLQVGHVERFNPAVVELGNLIKTGKFGKILSIVIKRVGLFPQRVEDVNVVTDLAVHDLDIVTNILGRLPHSVFARGGEGLIEGREDHAEIFLDYGEFGCFIQVNWITPVKIRTLAITGTKSYAEINYITQKMTLYESNYKLKQPKGFEEFIEFGEPRRHQIDLSGKEPLELELINFINSVRKLDKPKVTGSDGIRALILAEAATRSIKTGKLVKM